MLAPLLTLALLPLALAACSCPPAPAAAEVCGSDHKTYPSACDLDCTAPPGQCAPPPSAPAAGVAAAHPGPCRPADATLGRPTNATLLLSGRRARRSATEERQQFEACERKRQCGDVTCSECGVDWVCGLLCVRNCRCGCLGLQTSAMNSTRYSECDPNGECGLQYVACKRRCSTQECRNRCFMDLERCDCGCVQQAEGTTARPASSNPANTTGPADPTSPHRPYPVV
ncbi:Sodium- and chloride-dependent glycine transporter 2 [Frankliniella fusca]|uniref:Sodium- and chloride-dependent glycine transporter 2 n=1 Tax=Frankliniella fusca TaxID=407009 RepID=A0AAE1GQI1_9NEOP|nr:Sodium- and chloride-dependent glycine transporter 2 [Frankliniella fusca]